MGMAEKSKNPLSSGLKVACEIYRFNLNKQPIWFGKLVESLKGEMSKNTISNSIDTLFDWGIIKGEYGPTTPGRASRLLSISNETKPVIKELYERYWKNR
jgi:hypothetical protein